jgi:hypothetical protein
MLNGLYGGLYSNWGNELNVYLPSYHDAKSL